MYSQIILKLRIYVDQLFAARNIDAEPYLSGGLRWSSDFWDSHVLHIDLKVSRPREYILAVKMRILKNECSTTDSYDCIRKNLYFMKYTIL